MPTIEVADAYAYLETTSVIETVLLLHEVELVAREFDLPDIAQISHEISIGLLHDVNEVAVRIAGISEALIIEKIIETAARNRPQQGNLQAHILSEPGAAGLVKVGMIEELDKAINPNGRWNTYWRAQEFGTGVGEGGYGGGGIPTQIDRRLFGTFEPSETPPDSAQQGLGEGHDLAFLPMGSAPGEGRISVDLPGRHFLRDGSRLAAERYIEQMTAVGEKWNAKLRGLLLEIDRQKRSRAQGSFLGIIEA